MRRLAHPSLDHFPSNGLLALEETLTAKRREAIALARGYAMGTIYATANPEGAIRALWATWPSTKPTDRDEATALKDAVAMLLARAPAWQLDRAGAKLWGEHVEKNYQAYLDWLHANTFINEKVVGQGPDHQRPSERDQRLRRGRCFDLGTPGKALIRKLRLPIGQGTPGNAPPHCGALANLATVLASIRDEGFSA